MFNKYKTSTFVNYATAFIHIDTKYLKYFSDFGEQNSVKKILYSKQKSININVYF